MADSSPGLDSRLIPLFLAAGWFLVTLGLWGAIGEPWWLWPLSVGLGLLGAGAVYGWALWRQLLAKAAAPEAETGPRRVSA